MLAISEPFSWVVVRTPVHGFSTSVWASAEHTDGILRENAPREKTGGGLRIFVT